MNTWWWLKRLEDLLESKGIQDNEIKREIEEIRLTLEQNKTDSTANNKDYIEIPMNPILKETVDLGGAEMAAGVYNVLWTAMVNTITNSTLALAIAGPVIEKIGFFIWEAIKAYRTHHKEGTAFKKEFKANITNGIKNIIVDICIHDTIYSSLMVYGLTHETVSATVLSVFSFIIALPPAILMKYSWNELLYFLQKEYSKLHRFNWENYYEARFIVNNYSNPESIFNELWKEFWLWSYNKSTYHDSYYQHHIPSFSDRIGTVKLRKVSDETGNARSFQNLEIAYTLPTKKTPEKESIYNYFYSFKEKWRKTIPIGNEEIINRWIYKKLLWEEKKDICFNREIIYNHELRVALDEITEPTSSNIKKIIELKVYKDKKYLMEAMHKVMKDKSWDVQITTHPKIKFM